MEFETINFEEFIVLFDKLFNEKYLIIMLYNFTNYSYRIDNSEFSHLFKIVENNVVLEINDLVKCVNPLPLRYYLIYNKYLGSDFEICCYLSKDLIKNEIWEKTNILEDIILNIFTETKWLLCNFEFHLQLQLHH